MFPRWLSWLIFLALGYLIIQGNRAQRPELPTALPPQQEQVATAPITEPKPATPELPNTAGVTTTPTTRTISEVTDMERWKRALNPDYAARSQCELKARSSDKPTLLWKVTEEVAGAGAGAKCTESIPVKLTVWNAKGEVAYAAEQLTFTLGTRDVAAGLDAALVGIKAGGSRTVVMGPEALVRNKKSDAPKALLNAIGTGRVVVVTVERL